MRDILTSLPEEFDETGVDITPMLDVVFIMLIFFIVTATFIKESGIEVDKPDRPELSDLPKAPPISQPSRSLTGQVLTVTAPVRPGRDLEIGRTGLGLGTGDGDYLPIVKVAPMYPRRAQQLGITGECLVRYTVTTSGTVRDVEVVPDGCSDPPFARPSINAARRFKYKPRVIDGTPVEVLNVYNMFHFETAPTSGAEQ